MAREFITIDGSEGEGGGQILRSALALSACTVRAFRITRIRANRPKSGLMRQHLTAVRAAQVVCDATVTGDALRSTELSFVPGQVKPGRYTFAVGSAGSATLVLQTVLPALLCAGGVSELTLEGGTHNPFAPPFDFLDRAFVPLINRMGPRVELALDRVGFAPAGGGRFRATIDARRKLAPIDLSERGAIRRRLCTAIVSGLPGEIAERELDCVRAAFDWPADAFQHRRFSDDQGPGNILLIEIQAEHVTEVFTGFGQRGVRAEAVADEAIEQVRAYLAAEVPIGPHLADQLLLPMALAGGGSFLTVRPTLHTRTNAAIIQRFLPVSIEMADLDGRRTRISIAPL